MVSHRVPGGECPRCHCLPGDGDGTREGGPAGGAGGSGRGNTSRVRAGGELSWGVMPPLPRRPLPAMAGTGSASASAAAVPAATAVSTPSAAGLSRAEVVARYGKLRPDYWGFGGPGVVRDLHTTRRLVALTFDACGGPGGSEYDAALIEFLRQREVPATLFLNSRWIDENPAVFQHCGASRCSSWPTTAPGTCRCRSPGGPPTASVAPGTRARSTTRWPRTRSS